MLHLTSCNCPGNQHTRVHRTPWMRVLAPARRFFECGHCGRRFFVRPDSTRVEQRVALLALGFLLMAVVTAGLTLWPGSGSPRLAVADMPTAQAAVHEKCSRVHVVREGETLQTIADMELGDPEKWQQIRIANQQRLDTYDTGLADGTRLVVPVRCVD
jgi:hypothetical protein